MAHGLLSEAAEERPLLCVVDDAQWLDRASARALGFMARRLLAERIALVFAARELGEALAGFLELHIGPLGHRERALLESVDPLSEAPVQLAPKTPSPEPEKLRTARRPA